MTNYADELIRASERRNKMAKKRKARKLAKGKILLKATPSERIQDNLSREEQFEETMRWLRAGKDVLVRTETPTVLLRDVLNDIAVLPVFARESFNLFSAMVLKIKGKEDFKVARIPFKKEEREKLIIAHIKKNPIVSPLMAKTFKEAVKEKRKVSKRFKGKLQRVSLPNKTVQLIWTPKKKRKKKKKPAAEKEVSK